ncbi:hypothetical protein LCGC14_3025850 [marine sediment metagenome]|uniref:Uncharacterized protein n=1 Tax=marine sediment metagenome TaxID=412755 RepID=A0A0F8WU74_9ZZZZ
MPALGGFNPQGAFGGLRGEKPRIPQAFFEMEEEEIVALLVGMGYSEKNARVDVTKFMEYKARTVGPKQIWSDDDEAKEQEEPSANRQNFGQRVAYLKGGRDGQ